MSLEQDTAEEYAQSFIDNAKESRTVWGLWSEATGWTSIDSDQDPDLEVILFWSERESAEKHAQDEWRDHSLIAIPLEEFLETTLVEMNEEGVLIGPDWDEDFIGLELPPTDLTARLTAESSEPAEESYEEEED